MALALTLHPSAITGSSQHVPRRLSLLWEKCSKFEESETKLKQERKNTTSAIFQINFNQNKRFESVNLKLSLTKDTNFPNQKLKAAKF